MSDYGIVTEAGAVRFERLLAAPVERVWDYLTQSELRRQWFAGGEMELRPGGRFTLVFRNGELSHHDEPMPKKFEQYEGMESTAEIVEADPPRRLVFEWHEESGPPTEVTWELERRGEQTLLTLTHRRAPDRAILVDVSAGWHIHLDILEDILAGREPRPFWSTHAGYEKAYEEHMPAF